jgi:molecular chaperone GrpE
MSAEQDRDSISTSVKGTTNSRPHATDVVVESPTDSTGVQGEEIKSSEKEITDVVEPLKKELENEQKKNTEISKRMLYLQSDYANLQRLSERRIAEAIDETKLRFIEEYISVKEDLERAMSVAKASMSSTLFDALRMLLSRIEGSLRSEEVERIKAPIGSTFDPRLHEAVAYSEGNSEEDGTIVSVVSNGYTMRGKVIKPALVEVARQNREALRHDQTEETQNDETAEHTLGEEVQVKKEFKEEPMERKISPKENEPGVN